VTLLESLLDAIVRLEGDALVMHVGEKPYVVTTSSSMNAYRGPLAWGQVELSSRVLTSEAVLSMVGQILPPAERQALDDLGAVEHEISAPAGSPDRFTVVAARGGDDIWLELRRHPGVAAPAVETRPAAATAEAVQAELPGVAVGLQERPPHRRDEDAASPAHGLSEAAPELAPRGAPPAAEEPAAEAAASDATIEERVPVFDEVSADRPEHVEHIRIPVNGEDAAEAEASSLEVVDPEPQHLPTEADVDAMLAETAGALLTGGPDPSEHGWVDPDAATELILIEHEEIVEYTETGDESAAVDVSGALELELQRPKVSEEVAFKEEQPPELQTPSVEFREEQPVDLQTSNVELQEEQQFELQTSNFEVQEEQPFDLQTSNFELQEQPFELQTSNFELQEEAPVDHTSTVPKPRPEHPAAKPAFTESVGAGAHQAAHAGGVVVPLSRTAGGTPERPAPGGRVDDEALLHMLRVAAERAASTVYVVAQSRPMVRIDGEISALEGEPILSANDIERLTASLAPRRPETPEGPAEWISEVPEVGRVRCMTFRDHRGPGLIFRMIPAKSISADHLNLSPELRDLCAQADGLVLVTGARGSGKSTLLNSFVDLINRTRSDHVITIETEIGFVHESRRSFVSQREVHNDPAAAAAAAQAALKEDPDVLMIEDLHSPESVSAALEAAESGRLVFASLTAPSSAAAIDALVEMFPAGQRAPVRAMLSRTLRAVVGQVQLRKAAGGRVTARELLLNSPAVAASIREGKPVDIPAAVESGSRHGMISMSDALAALVRGGTVHSAEAYRRAPDRAALLACLAREGVDTSFAERFA